METSSLTEAELAQYILGTFPGVETTTNFGYTFFFYDSDRMLPFATIASSGNEYERGSNLDRPGVFRLNIGVSRQTFRSLFGPGPSRRQRLRLHRTRPDHAAPGLCLAELYLRAQPEFDDVQAGPNIPCRGL